MSKVIADKRERQLIEEALDINLLVEAGAGSGKTTCLVKRMIYIITSGKGKVGQIVAITFTRKAAEELKERFIIELEKHRKNTNKEEVRQRLDEALQSLEECFIGTVHSFCSKLLKERPIEAGVDIGFKEIDNEEEKKLIYESLCICMNDGDEEYQAIKEELFGYGIKVDNLVKYTLELNEYKDVQWVTKEKQKPDLASVYSGLVAIVENAIKAIPEEKPDKGYDTLQEKIMEFYNKSKYIGSNQIEDIVKVLEIMEGELKITQNRWLSKEEAKEWKATLEDYRDRLVTPALLVYKEYMHNKLIKFISYVVDKYDQVKRAYGVVTLQDLIIKTRDMLKNNSNVRINLASRYRFLLVDEFQDTDPIQAEIMFYITGENQQAKTWQETEPRQGSLFVVGDPKQAIYRFRRADIGCYNQVKELLEAGGGRVLKLTTNFRSVSAITEKLNECFSTQFPNEANKYQAAYAPLLAHEETHNKIEGISVLTVPGEKLKKEKAIAYDSYNIVQVIKQMLQEGYSPRDFMVINRYNESLIAYAKALQENNIPVSVTGKIVLMNIPEIRELLILLEAIKEDYNPIKIAAALKGLFFGVSDVELFQWHKIGGNLTMYSKPQTDHPPKIQSYLEQLQMYKKWTRQYEPTVAIEKIMEHIGLYTLLVRENYTKDRYNYFSNIFDKLVQLQLNGITSFSAMVESLKEELGKEIELGNEDDEADVVRVMNVHKCKGLQAPIVFLAHPCKNVNPFKYITKHIERDGIESRGYFAFTLPNGSNHNREVAIPENWNEKKEDEFRYLQAEETRILYVGATRAKKRLIISSMEDSKKNPWNTLLSMSNLEVEEVQETEVCVDNRGSCVDKNGYKEQIESYRNWIDSKKYISYEEYVPSKSKDYALLDGVNREEGGGLAWGNFVHDLLDKEVSGKMYEGYIKVARFKYGIEDKKEDVAIKLLDQFKKSTIADDIKHAEVVLTEVPIHMYIDSSQPMYTSFTKTSEDIQAIKVNAIIDLVYKKDGKWYIVDYKTDHIQVEGIPAMIEFYKPQVMFYKDAWKELTGEKVEKVLLFFNELNHIEEVVE
nr:UvrD-helicase domain-containing protein [uncultured Niameybacter sp.]